MSIDYDYELDRVARQYVTRSDKRNQIIRAAPRADTFSLVFALDGGSTPPPLTYVFPSIALPQSCALTRVVISTGGTTFGTPATARYSIYYWDEESYILGLVGILIHPASPNTVKPNLSNAILQETDISLWTTRVFPRGYRLSAELETFSQTVNAIQLELTFRKTPVYVPPPPEP